MSVFKTLNSQDIIVSPFVQTNHLRNLGNRECKVIFVKDRKISWGKYGNKLKIL